jgi:hypothetical protein
MICKITQVVIDAQGMSQELLGKWLAVIHGHKFVFDNEQVAITYRAMMRSYSKYNVVVQ